MQLGSPGRGLETFSGVTPREVPEHLRHGEELGDRGSNLSLGYLPRTPTRRVEKFSRDIQAYSPIPTPDVPEVLDVVIALG
ncbi:ClC family transporter: chloride ion channel [Dorcoceras hygrometricum]|uniref:ClC family transporter: chloride ion channel n=1 Tax=Dorcoceras hygrometricum TaxID=472368 RepID=A0A2Z7CAC1_9LAMI|nr:ClC family transporter: chloride ion channel [Dorcoceras hygrometricum]